MAYSQFYAYAQSWLVSEEYVIYADDTGHLPEPKVREMVDKLSNMATESAETIELWLIEHPHIDDMESECICSQYASPFPYARINGNSTTLPQRRNRHV